MACINTVLVLMACNIHLWSSGLPEKDLDEVVLVLVRRQNHLHRKTCMHDVKHVQAAWMHLAQKDTRSPDNTRLAPG